MCYAYMMRPVWGRSRTVCVPAQENPGRILNINSARGATLLDSPGRGLYKGSVLFSPYVERVRGEQGLPAL